MRVWLLSVLMFYYTGGAPTAAYDGDNMLAVLGQSRSSQAFKDFSKYWLLSKADESRSRGIKVLVNPITDTVENITISGTVEDLSDTKFQKCTATLPMQVSLEDDIAALSAKLGHGEKLPGRNTLVFYSQGKAIEATYSNLKGGKIMYLKFSIDPAHHVTVFDTVPVIKKKEDRAAKRLELEQSTFLTANTTSATVQPSKVHEDTASLTPFKKVILDIFKASKEFSFINIKAGDRKEGNFWNYKYTYNTNIKVPGEKYNMLYCFPFPTSQLDFVVVLKESNSFEKSFTTLYHNYEKLLAASFPESEGWAASCLPGKDKSQLPDLEYRNDKYGAVILDHTQKPDGKHVLYLRFLLFSD